MNQLTLIHTVTMTSLELVDYINSQRKEGDATLAHSDFLKKVPQVLGKDAGNFSSIYLDSMNREKPCYHFPKREACLMAMSYSYDLQAKVFDRMTALEEQQRMIPPQQKAREPRLPQSQPVRDLLLIGRAMSKIRGVNEALAMACTLDAIERTTGLPAMLLTKALPSVAPEQTATLNATQVGEPLGLSGRTANALLEKLGLQYRDENKNWKLTEAGTAYGEMKPFHRNGHSGYETRWKLSVADVVRKHLDSMEKAA